MVPSLCYVTLSVPSITQAVRFYTEQLGFEVYLQYEPTKWVAFKMNQINDSKNNPGFAIAEDSKSAFSGVYMVDFFVHDIEKTWNEIRENSAINVVSPLQKTPWGSEKFVISDLFDNNLGFVKIE